MLKVGILKNLGNHFNKKNKRKNQRNKIDGVILRAAIKTQ